MMMTRYAPLLLIVSACASETGPGQPVTCDPEARKGTYKLEYSKESGDCPTPPTSLVNTEGSDTSGCKRDGEARTSEGGCKAEDVFLCPGGVKVTQIFRQTSADGSRVEGTQSVTGGGCSGLFRVVGTRQ